MYGIDDFLYLLGNVLFTVFKNRPSVAYKISALILILILVAMFLFDQDPSDRAFAIFGILYVFSVTGHQLLQAIRQQSVRDFQAIGKDALTR